MSDNKKKNEIEYSPKWDEHPRRKSKRSADSFSRDDLSNDLHDDQRESLTDDLPDDISVADEGLDESDLYYDDDEDDVIDHTPPTDNDSQAAPKKKRGFVMWIIYAVWCLILIAGMLYTLDYAKKSLTLYEAARPEHLMESLVDSVSSDGLSDHALLSKSMDGETTISYNIAVNNTVSCNYFENPYTYVAQLNDILDRESLTYEKTGQDFSTGALTYALFAGDLHFGDITLQPTGSYTRMKLLTMTDWEPEDITIFKKQADYSIQIDIPDNFTVTVNGMPVPDAYTISEKECSDLEFCEKYVTVPGTKTILIPGFQDEAIVDIKDSNGEDAECTVEEIAKNNDGSSNPESISENADSNIDYPGSYASKIEQINYSCGFPSPEMPDDLKDTVLDMTENYSLFFTRDLPGSTASIDPIRYIFPEDSEYLKLAETYRRQDMEIIVAHSNTHFDNVTVDDYTVYNNECFSCHVVFDKIMTMYGKEVVDDTDSVYYFVLIDGEWKIADIR